MNMLNYWIFDKCLLRILWFAVVLYFMLLGFNVWQNMLELCENSQKYVKY